LMAVTRRGEQRASDRVDTQALGRVLVTIDDLESLIDLLGNLREKIDRGPDADFSAVSDLKLEFDGGSFENAEDLRKLSDEELKRITVKTSKIEVILSPSEAFAIGDPVMAKKIYNQWARARQVKIRPEKRAWQIILVAGIFLSVGVAAAWASIAGGSAPVVSRIVIGALGIFSCVGSVLIFNAMPEPFAVVRPVTLDEFRRERAVNNRHWIMATIALGSLCVALAGVLVAVLVRK
jgi:hypothetical protein